MQQFYCITVGMDEDQIDFVFKALAHPERRRILDFLHRQGEQSLFEICAFSHAESGQPLARQTVTQHLDMLERAGLIDVSWKGRTKAHSVNLGPLREAIGHAVGTYL
ncbi:ArsR/SmtB family transcription factor [Rhodophyticola sp.]|uniref:ArsR/SmtB family transcription factor n=1 Tax=Rhodophyticola sp. TaxID=2680032 RepID=UPI003D29EA90